MCLRRRWLCLVFVPVASAVCADTFSVAPAAGFPGAERIGPPTAYLPHLSRFREPVPGPGKHPVPQDPVTRDTYYQWLADSGHFAYAEGDRPTRHGRIGPRHFMPVLANFVKTGDPAMGEALLTMLRHFDKWLREKVERVGYHSWFQDETIYLGLYMRYLEEGGLLDREDPWFRDMVLTFIDTLHVWGNEKTFWRGAMHRSQAEGINRYLGAMWYPDAPQAREWKRYAGIVYRDFWDFKDLIPNDTGYLFAALWPLTVGAHLKGDEEFFNHPEMRRLWERLMHEVSPDGSVIPYGAHGGWNSNVGARIGILEIVARHTGDGRYRWAAHRLMNYLRYQQEHYWRHHWLAGPDTTERLAVAYLLADDGLAPVQPDSGSMLLYRKEAIGVRSKEAAMRRGFYHDMDPAPDRHELSSPLTLLDNVKPSKLVLRSGWTPGDFFVLVDLYPRHAPVNAGALLGMTRWGAGLGMPVNAKFEGRDNRLLLEDLSGTAEPRHTTDPDLMYRLTSETGIPIFTDQARATFAAITVSNYDGFPVRYEREFAFIKNRLLVTREIAEFEQGFLALLAPAWATQNVGPQIGTHWANTYCDELRASNTPLRNPPYDLLVWFAPRADRVLQVVDRTQSDARTADVPWEVRYAWRGVTRPGERLLFTQVYCPRPPSLDRPASNAPGAAGPAGTAGADGIHLLRDDLECSVLRFTFEADREEWVVINPGGAAVREGGLETDARYLYVDLQGGEVRSVNAAESSFLSLNGREIFRLAERADVQE